MQIKQVLSLIIKILFTVLISFLFLELLLLIFNDLVFRNTFHIYDPDMGYKTRPYARWGNNVANEFGFNDRDYPHQKAPGTYRILILGDSFNWAGGLDGNYTAILERKFADEFGEGRVEVINAGYDGTHTGEQLQALKKFGLQYNPDLVVLGFFVGNDFLDANPYRKRIAVSGSYIDIDTRKDREITFLGQLLVPLQSRLYLFLKEKWIVNKFVQAQQQSEIQQLTQQSTEQDNQVEVSAVPYTMDNISDEYLDYEFRRIQVSNWALASNYASDEFQLYEGFVFENLLKMRDLLTDKQIPFMVVAYPDSFQVDETLLKVIVGHYQVDTSTYQLDRPQGLLWQFSTEHNIEFYDMLPVFQEAAKQGQKLYLHNDTHWNKAGNTLAADFLFEILVWKVRENLP